MAIRPARTDGVPPPMGGASDVDRPRPGANQTGAGSPTTQQEAGAVEVSSMTDAAVGLEWVPRFGLLEVSAERAALIRGLYELAAWVADHPELPVPSVDARVSTLGERSWDDERALVDRVAEALDVPAAVAAKGHHYMAAARLGPVRVSCTAITRARLAAHAAVASYSDNVQPDDAS